MATLSSNWKKLQAKLKAESESKPSAKRKADDDASSAPTKAKKPKSSSSASSSKTGTKPNTGPRESILKKINGTGGKMGAAQSTLASGEQKHGVRPSAALWGAANGVSPEALAEAYQLGARDSSTVLSARGNDKVNQGLAPGLELGKYIALDCEMVGVGPGGHESALARVSAVDFHGRQVYDSYVRPRERVTDWRTPVSGVAPRDMRAARDFAAVQADVAALLDGRVLVGHDVRHDLDALQLSHPLRDVRDTARHAAFKRHAHGRKPALRVLAQTLLDVEIQAGAHSSLEDARVTMLLFRRHKSEFDVDNANRYAPKPAAGMPGGANTKKAKKKKR